ncbi:MAG: hypothetical protein RMK18_11285 [Armatimonadota bacterium]|nr:hypothetical protein [Armatimonadota bacterium]MDW8026431.1 hypothetical protein [Armatimonadota bacterium]
MPHPSLEDISCKITNALSVALDDSSREPPKVKMALEFKFLAMQSELQAHLDERLFREQDEYATLNGRLTALHH